MESGRLFLFLGTIIILGTCGTSQTSEIGSQEEGRGINILKWIFGEDQNQVPNTNINTTTATTNETSNTSSIQIPPPFLSESRIPTNGRRVRRQMMPIIPEEEEEEEQESKDTSYQEEQSREDGPMTRLSIPFLEQSQLDGISIQVEPSSGEGGGSVLEIEDYDTSRDDGEFNLSSSLSDEEPNEVGVRTPHHHSRRRSLSTPPNVNSGGMDSFLSSTLDRRRPVSRGHLDGVENSTNTRKDVTHVPVLSPATTPPPSSSTMRTETSTNGKIPAIHPSYVQNNSGTSPLPPTPTSSSPSPTIPESVIMNSVPSSFTPSQGPIMTTTVDSPGSSHPNSTGEDTTTSPPLLPRMSAILNCQCGTQSISTRKGSSTTFLRVMTHPWLVGISSQNKHLCAGSVINDRYVLTGANCIDMYEKRELRVHGGLQLESPQIFRVRKVVLHPGYDPSTFENNIALLRLSDRIRPSRIIKPICLPLLPSQPHPTANLVTWTQQPTNQGTGKQRKRNLHLLQTEVELWNSTICRDKGGAAVEGLLIPNGTICTSPPAQHKCGGDIGGVLQAYAGKFSYEQVGLVSLSVGCRANDLPGIYTDVRHYLRWILFQTQDAHYCREPHGRSPY